MYEDLGELLVRVYEISISGVPIGYCDEPEVEVTKILEPITLSQLHKQVMGHRILGVSAKAKFKVRQITKARMALVMPWAAGSEASMPIMPDSLGGDTYADAVPIAFHPVDMAEDTNEDITLLKGYPTGPFRQTSDGVKDHVIEMEYEFYPDRNELPNFVLGYIGPAA